MHIRYFYLKIYFLKNYDFIVVQNISETKKLLKYPFYRENNDDNEIDKKNQWILTI